MICIQGLTKTYRGNVQALRGIDLDIEAKGIFGLLGVNGAGKTTLIRILAGLLNSSSGEVTIFGHDLRTRQGKIRTKEVLGYLPQDMGVYPNLTAREFLDYVAILKGVNNSTARKHQIDDLLEQARLEDVSSRKLKEMSGGMRQRVCIAQALLGQPRLLIVDEPTAGLDPEERVRVRNLLSDIAQTTTVIFSTHIVEDMGYTCHDLAVLFQGKVIFRGSPARLVAAAEGKAWIITSQDGMKPDHGLVLVSSRQMVNGIQYRVLGDPDASYAAVPDDPSLEDGYIWLMSQVRRQLLSLPVS